MESAGSPSERLKLRPEWFAPLSAVLTGGAYVLGYLEIVFFTSRLGLTPRDVGLDTQDYLLLSFVHIGGMVVAAGVFMVTAALESGTNSELRRWLIGTRAVRLRSYAAGLLRMFFFALTSLIGFNLGLGSSGFIIFAITGTALALAVEYRSTKRVVAYSSLGVAALTIVTGALLGAHNYGDTVLAAAARGERPPLAPLPLRAVLRPVVGTATADDKTSCVVRMSEKVMVGKRARAVGEVDRFIVDGCAVVAVPFG